jgi:hypothetical protein
MKRARAELVDRPRCPAAIVKVAKRLRAWDAVAAQDTAEIGELLGAMRRVKARLILEHPGG